MIFAVYVLAILVAALIWRDITKEIKINDHRRDHNALAETVREQGKLIEAQRLPDPDKTKIISSILDIMYPRKYPDGHIFINEDGDQGYITDTYVVYDASDAFDRSGHVRYYRYFRPAVFSYPSRESLLVSEKYLDTIANVRSRALAECQAKKEPACKRKPACKKKKGGKKS